MVIFVVVLGSHLPVFNAKRVFLEPYLLLVRMIPPVFVLV